MFTDNTNPSGNHGKGGPAFLGTSTVTAMTGAPVGVPLVLYKEEPLRNVGSYGRDLNSYHGMNHAWSTKSRLEQHK